jgi:acid phosphatase
MCGAVGATILSIAVAACGSASQAARPKAPSATTTTSSATTTPAATTPTATTPTATTSAGPTPPTARAPTPTPAGAPSTTRAASAPHVMVVMMENKSYDQVIGQASQPYTNSLAQNYGLATGSYGFGHPSLPNYLDLISGSDQGVSDDNPPSAHSFPGVATLADQLVGAGFKVKAYAEDLPADPRQNSGEYAVRHFPWVYFPTTKMPIADASTLIADLNSPDPPDFVWYTPNLINDEHDGTVQDGDAFLARLIPEVQATGWYRAGGRIIIEWDESDNDNAGINGTGGGHIPTIVVSEALKAAPRKETSPVDTTGILASIEDVYGVGHLAGAANPANGNISALLH